MFGWVVVTSFTISVVVLADSEDAFQFTRSRSYGNCLAALTDCVMLLHVFSVAMCTVVMRNSQL